MIKKYEDITIKEFWNFCNKFKYCSDCPLFQLEKQDDITYCIPQFIDTKNTFGIEIEVPEND